MSPCMDKTAIWGDATIFVYAECETSNDQNSKLVLRFRQDPWYDKLCICNCTLDWLLLFVLADM